MKCAIDSKDLFLAVQKRIYVKKLYFEILKNNVLKTKKKYLKVHTFI